MLRRIIALTVLATTLNALAADKNKEAFVLQKSSSPLVNFRILFMTGAADDPAGKKGIAALTAAMLSQGGSEKLAYDEIVKQFYPMAAGFSAQVDKEMTVFSGATHKDTLEKYYGLIRQMLLEPGFQIGRAHV